MAMAWDNRGCLALLVLTVLLAACGTEGARILGIFPTTSPSHYISASAWMRGLAAKGHEVTVIAPFELKEPVPRYRLIHIPEAMDNPYIALFLNNSDGMGKVDIVEIFTFFSAACLEMCRILFEAPNVKQLLASPDEHFDAVVVEVFMTEPLFGFAEHYKAPIIGFSSMGATSWHTQLVGAPAPASVIPFPFLKFSGQMTYAQRLLNIVVHGMDLLYYNYAVVPKQNAMYAHYFPNASRSLAQMRQNVSLVVLNQHFSLSMPRPYTPNVIEAGGMHIDRKVRPLPADIKAVLDNATEGAIYFSLGSNFKSDSLPPAQMAAILGTFAKLKQRVLWKLENADLPGLPANVFVRAWYPQNDILAHPNVKLFITHGGLLSTMETVYHGKPIVGIPLFGDQHMNMNHAVRSGLGLQLDYGELTGERFHAALVEVLENPSYAARVQQMSRAYRDQPLLPLDTAVFWTEYVIRHRGAPHMRSPAMALNLWQYYSVDTIAALVLLLAGVGLLAGVAVKATLRLICRGQRKVKTH